MTNPANLARFSKPLAIASIALVVLGLSYLRVLDNYELELLDARFLLRGARPTVDDVVLIEIGDDTIEKLEQWPLDRIYYAIMIKALSDAGAKAILCDIFFSDPSGRDKELEEAMEAAKNVYLPIVFDIKSARGPEKIMSSNAIVAKLLERFRVAAKGTGHINIVPDPDGKYRRVPLYLNYKGNLHPYLSFLLVCDWLGIDQKAVRMLPGKYLLLPGGAKIPLDDKSNMIVNFSCPWAKSFKHYSFVDILQSHFASLTGQKPILDLTQFKGKLCIIGLTATGTVDLHPTPFERLYPGMGVHAELFNSIIKKSFIRRASRQANAVILLFIAIFISVVTMRTRPVKGLIILLGTLALFLVVAVALFILFGLWVDLFYPVVAMSVVYLSLTFYKYIVERQKRMLLENELDIARRIQESFLPKAVPQAQELELAAKMYTARQVGGDLYDFLDVGKGRLGVMIGDVSGKGVPASLFMAKVTSEFKFFATTEIQPSRVLLRLNDKLVAGSSSNLFVTVFYIIIDPKKRSFVFSNGGHLPAILLKNSSEEVELLKTDDGLPIGLAENSYSDKSMKLGSGDAIVLYTDGVTEAMDRGGKMYGEERLYDLVKAKRYLGATSLLEAIREDVKRFERGSTQHDDITLMVIKAK